MNEQKEVDHPHTSLTRAKVGHFQGLFGVQLNVPKEQNDIWPERHVYILLLSSVVVDSGARAGSELCVPPLDLQQP